METRWGVLTQEREPDKMKTQPMCPVGFSTISLSDPFIGSISNTLGYQHIKITRRTQNAFTRTKMLRKVFEIKQVRLLIASRIAAAAQKRITLSPGNYVISTKMFYLETKQTV